jgi:hypothetical protein
MIYILIAFGVFLFAVGIAYIPEIKKNGMQNQIQKDRIFGSPGYSTYNKIESNKSMIPGNKISWISKTIKFEQISKIFKKLWK